MAAILQDIPTFVLEHKWSSDIESNDSESTIQLNEESSKFLFPLDNLLEKNEEKTEDVRVGSNVKVVVNSKTQRGVIRWIGTSSETAPGKLMAVVELVKSHLLSPFNKLHI